MQLTLKSLQQIQDTSVEALGLLKCVEAEGNAELQMELQNLSVQASGAIQILEQFTNIRDSLKVAGYSDQWYDITFGNSNLKDLCTIEMPKFLDNDVNRGKACMEGIMTTLVDWIKKAGQLIVKIIKGLIQFIGWVNVKLKELFNSDDAYKKRNKPFLDRLVTAVSNAVNSSILHVNVEDYYDFSKIDEYVANTRIVIDLICKLKDNNGVYAANTSSTPEFLRKLTEGNIVANTFLMSGTGNGNKQPDELKKMFYERLQTELTTRGISATGPNSVDNIGFVLKFDPANNKYVNFFGLADNKDFDKMTIDVSSIDTIVQMYNDQLEKSGKELYEAYRMSLQLERSLKSRIKNFQDMADAPTYISGQAESTDTNMFVNETKAGIILTMCALPIIQDATRFLIKVLNAHNTNKKTIDTLIRTVYVDAQKQ